MDKAPACGVGYPQFESGRSFIGLPSRQVANSLFIMIVLLLPAMASMQQEPTSPPGTIWNLLDHSYSQTDTLFRDMYLLNDTHGWVVGQEDEGLGSGIILHTNDSGDTWQVQLEDGPPGFFDIEVVDSDNLWVTSRGRLLHSTDGGQTWDNSTIIGSGRGSQSSVRFFNHTRGWTSTNDDLFRTFDGGQTWHNVTAWPFGDSARDFHFISGEEIWVLGFYGIYHTSDDGESWEQRHNQGGRTMSFVSDSEAWTVGDGMLAHMTDGQTWLSQELPRPSPLGGFRMPYFSDITFLDSSNGWIAGMETPMAYTPNGGWDWYEQSVPVDTRIMSVHFLNQTHGWAAGGDGVIMRTTTGNSMGARLWKGLTDQVVLMTVGIPLAGVITAIAIVIRVRRRRRGMSSIQPSANL